MQDSGTSHCLFYTHIILQEVCKVNKKTPVLPQEQLRIYHLSTVARKERFCAQLVANRESRMKTSLDVQGIFELRAERLANSSKEVKHILTQFILEVVSNL